MNTTIQRVASRGLTAAALIALGACASMTPTQTVNLTGDAEVPAHATAGQGTGTFTVSPDGSVSGSMTAYNFTPTMGHIHIGAPGVNGPAIVPMTKTGQTLTVPAGSRLTAEQLAAYRAGNLYVNIHSVGNPDGEVRAQLKGL